MKKKHNSTSVPDLLVYEMIAPAISTIRCHPAYSKRNLFPVCSNICNCPVVPWSKMWTVTCQTYSLLELSIFFGAPNAEAIARMVMASDKVVYSNDGTERDCSRCHEGQTGGRRNIWIGDLLSPVQKALSLFLSCFAKITFSRTSESDIPFS